MEEEWGSAEESAGKYVPGYMPADYQEPSYWYGGGPSPIPDAPTLPTEPDWPPTGNPEDVVGPVGWNDLGPSLQNDPYMRFAFSTQHDPYAWNRYSGESLDAEQSWNQNAMNQVRDTLQQWIMPGYQQQFNATPWNLTFNPLEIMDTFGGQPNALALRDPQIINYALPDYNTMMHETAHTFGQPFQNQFYQTSNQMNPEELANLRYRFDYLRQGQDTPEGNERYWNMPSERYAAMAQQPYLIPESLRQYYPWLDFSQGMLPPGDTVTPWRTRPHYPATTLWDRSMGGLNAR